jgi:hypothetical protein
MVRFFTYNCKKKVKLKKGLLILSVLTMMIVEMSFTQSNIAVKDSLSEKELGEFPYFKIHDSHKAANAKTKKYEEKYFFCVSATVNSIEGKYYHATVYAKEGEAYNEALVINHLRKQITPFKAVSVYSGSIPNKASKLIYEEKPPYIKDLYDAIPYQYKQYLIKTKEANIWIEIIYGLNAQQMDFTVMREELSEK